MALRLYPISASRWTQLAASRLPIDLTESESEACDPGRRIRAEHALIQAYVDALEPRQSSAAR